MDSYAQKGGVQYGEVGRRFAAHWWLKLVGIPGFIALFFAAYFFVLRFPFFPVTVVPLSAIDRLIDFHPGALPLYVSLWVYVSLVPSLMTDRRELIAYGLAAAGLCITGLAVFFFWPTCIPQMAMNWARYPGFAAVKAIDTSGNACPSLHVTFAVFSAIRLHGQLRRMGDRGFARGLSWCWCLGIVYSTLATKQHVAIDVFAGAALGILGAVIAKPQVKRLRL